MQIDFDPTAVTYEDLLAVFWDSHSPVYQSYSTQYKSIIFYHSEEQKLLAEQSKAEQEALTGQTIYTEIRPYEEFYMAEEYHQKYYLTRDYILIEDFKQIYPNPDDLVNSTAAARVNGLVYGYGTLDNINQFGLSEKGIERLLEITVGSISPGCAVPQ